MTKELQDYVWEHCLPKEFKEEVKYEYHRVATKASKEEYDLGFMHAHEGMFGIHNLTSDAEEEEMLYCEKSKVQEQYALNVNALRKGNLTDMQTEIATKVKDTLYYLFGSKCLPDEKEFAENANCSEPKPAEPKFKMREHVRVISEDQNGIDGFIVKIDKEDDGYFYTLEGVEDWRFFEPNLEPYADPEEPTRKISELPPKPDHANDFANILKDSFSKERRLNIAAMAMQGILSNTDRMKQYGEIAMRESETLTQLVARNAMRYADALIAESEKGGIDGKDNNR